MAKTKKIDTASVLDTIKDTHAKHAELLNGHTTFMRFVQAEFKDALAGLPRAERVAAVEQLKELGISLAAVAAVTGVTTSQIAYDLRNPVPATADVA